ncbi:hypothetical protein E2C01_079304 [Portunus trituberculatus]|uniref:C-type lectin domain-containing protein n=1 Tax=Portunus trituberculatus TaxID=210409 RepID=A0A5B7IWJ9_PORTR|nr:hypothetical protein [Portunus trituberculatus]
MCLGVLTDPPCACEGCQLDVSCFVTTETPANTEQAVRDCQQQGASMTTINLPRELRQVLQMAMDVGDDLWVQPSSTRIRAAGDSLLGITLNNIQWIEVRTNQSQESSDCLVVSREARGVVQEDCNIVHLAACSYTAFGEIISSSPV